MEKWFYLYSAAFALLTLGLLGNSSAQLVEYTAESPGKWTVKSLLDHALTEQDFHAMVEVMPDGKRVSFELSSDKQLRLVFPLVEPAPLSFSIAPCYGDIRWTLSWRPLSVDLVEVVQNDSPYGNRTFNLKSNFTQMFHKKRHARHNRKRRRVKPLGLGSRMYKTKIVEPKFDCVLSSDHTITYLFKRDYAVLDIDISNGTGEEPWIFSRSLVQAGLYIITVTSSSANSKVHSIASKHEYIYSHTGTIKAVSDKDSTNDHSLHLSWNNRFTDTGHSCLIISRKKMYSSLCSAKESLQFSSVTHDSSLIVGCIRGSAYSLPMTLRGKFFISIWNDNSLIPYVRATVQARPKRRLPRLKAGKMVSFTMHTGGFVEAQFVSRKRRKLHVAAVSCVGGVKLLIMNGKERVAAARGREALHLVVRHATKGKFRIKVSPDSSTMDHYRVHLVASHSARKLPIPRLPKNVKVRSVAKDCSTALIQWHRAKGKPSYCIAFRHHPSGKPPLIRPPLQCGWEQTIHHPDYFNSVDCIQEQKGRKQIYIKTNLQSNISYVVTILVKHPITGRILALFPSMFTMPEC